MSLPCHGEFLRWCCRATGGRHRAVHRKPSRSSVMRKLLAAGIACVLTLSAASIVVAGHVPTATPAASSDAFGFGPGGHGDHDARTATPIRHLVVIFQENVSFDHYFGTYPFAENPHGEPVFYALPFTPAVNGLSHRLL